MATNSKFANLSDGDLADALGSVKADLAPLAAREKAIKAEIKARGISVAEGALFRVVCAPVVKTVLDTDRLKAERPEVYAAYTYPSASERITITAVKGEAEAA